MERCDESSLGSNEEYRNTICGRNTEQQSGLARDHPISLRFFLFVHVVVDDENVIAMNLLESVEVEMCRSASSMYLCSVPYTTGKAMQQTRESIPTFCLQPLQVR